MELTVIERLLILNLLPKEGDFTTIKLVRKAREALSFNEEEHKQLNFHMEGEQTIWNDVKIIKEVDLGDLMVEKIREALKKKMTTRH